ncbi:MAG: heat-inducible transcriptional repressor HrcA [Corallococcus sp.]|nr:heat-inducible transcriptional repressor HrcA [Corallococcus sp.]
MLSDRKKKILCAVVDGYIETAQPISSRDIQQRCLQDCSSATIRNELSALESMGYLVQPHVSAGRVPSQKAFRMYVDELMAEDPLTPADVEIIDRYFSQKLSGVEDVVANVAKVISDVTNYTSVVVKEDLSDCITSIRLVDIGGGRVLVVIVTDTRLLKDAVIDLPDDFTSNMLKMSENWLNNIFVGKHVSQFLNFNYPYALVNKEFEQFNSLFKKIIDVLKQVSLANGMDVIYDGKNKIFEHSEYSDMDNAKNFLATLDHKEKIVEMFTEDSENKLTIKIGTEDKMPDGCSMVSAKINLGDNVLGNVGVIGPVRMNYKKVVSVLDKISNMIADLLDNN